MDALGFMISQTALVRQRVYELRYPSVDFARLVPVSTEGTGFESGIEHFSADMSGEMKEITPQTTELPLVEVTHDQHLVQIATYGVAMKWNVVEVEQAAMVPGLNLKERKMRAMRRAHDQTHWDLVLKGRSELSWDGLLNNSNVTSQDARDNGTGSSRLWVDKSADKILLDINELLEGIYTSTNTVAMADSLALPPGVWASLASTFISGTAVSVAAWIKENNVYTLQTGNPLMIKEIRGLENAAASNAARAIAWRNSPEVLEYHLVMPLRIFDPQLKDFDWCIPAMSRTGGLEIKLPSEVRYLDLFAA